MSDVFLRKSSGVIRAWSPISGGLYAYLVAGGGVGVYVFFMMPAIAAFPGANMYLAIAILTVWICIRWVAYGMLMSSMPRSGGDYVFQSRLLSGSLGFTLTSQGEIWYQPWWMYFGANTILVAFVPQILQFFGLTLGNSGLVDAGNALQSLGPWTALVLSLIIMWFFILVIMRGLKPYTILQNYFMMPFAIAALVVLAGMFLLVPTHSFIANFNAFQNVVSGNPDMYHTIIQKAKEVGYNANAPFSWYDTIALSISLYAYWTAISYAMALVGEIKGVQNLKNSWYMLFGATLLLFVTHIIGFAWANDYMGPGFLKSFAYLGVFAPDALPAGSQWRAVFPLFATISNNMIIGMILYIALLLAIVQGLFNAPLGASRMCLAQSFDRILPAWVGSVNRWGATDKFYIFFGIITSIVGIGLTGYPYIAGLINLALLAQFISFAAAIVAAIVFPWRAKKLWEGTPGSKYKIAGLPAITVCGIVGIALDIVAVAFMLTNPNYGVITQPLSTLIYAVALVIGSALWYFIAKSYRRREGIMIERAFKEVPPA
jgi:APA family basic amino acid/polyamine antiporter